MSPGKMYRFHCLCFTFISLISKLTVQGLHCYQCANPFGSMDPVLKMKLQKTNIFFPPTSGYNSQCHGRLGINDDNNPGEGRPRSAINDIEVQICSKPSCVTLTPNLPDSKLNFTIRGCVESVLKYSYRTRAKIGDDPKGGCRLVEAVDLFGSPFPGEPLQFILCYCNEDWCNARPQPHISLFRRPQSDSAAAAAALAADDAGPAEQAGRGPPGQHDKLLEYDTTSQFGAAAAAAAAQDKGSVIHQQHSSSAAAPSPSSPSSLTIITSFLSPGYDGIMIQQAVYCTFWLLLTTVSFSL